MSRSVKKGPYVDPKLMKKVNQMLDTGSKKPIKTWARSSVVLPEFVGLTFSMHNGKSFNSIFVTENMVGHKLGEFAPTRVFRSHGAATKISMEKT